jgi:hypothetical protein
MNHLAIHSVPRSGSTWLGCIFNSHPNISYSYQPLFSHAFKSRLTENSSLKEINDFFTAISTSQDEDTNQTESKKLGLVPSFHKSASSIVAYKEVRYHNILKNLLSKDENLKVIGLVRNPLSVIYSWLYTPKEFRRDLNWVIEEEWQYAPKKNQNKSEEFNGYEKWKEVTLLFEDLKIKFKDRFYLETYKNLLKDTLTISEQLFDFIKVPLHAQTAKFIRESKSKNKDDRYSVYKIKTTDTDWKNLPEHIIKFILKDLEGSVLEKYLS